MPPLETAQRSDPSRNPLLVAEFVSRVARGPTHHFLRTANAPAAMVWYDTPDCTEATIGQSLRLLVSNLVLVVIVLASSSTPRRVSAATLHNARAFPAIRTPLTQRRATPAWLPASTGTVWFHGKNIVVRSGLARATILKHVAAGGSIVDIGPAGEFVSYCHGRQATIRAGLHVHGDGTSATYSTQCRGDRRRRRAVWGDHRP